jgi:hypothetical protein
MYLQKVKSKKKILISFFGVLKVNDENGRIRIRIRNGSISQRDGSADPETHQNVMDPEHCVQLCITFV